MLRWSLMALLAAWLLGSCAVAADGSLLLVIRDESPDPVPGIRALLTGHAFDLEPAPRWPVGGSNVYVARRPATLTDAELFAAIAAAEAAPAVSVAGELLSQSADSVRFFAGVVLIRFQASVSEAFAEATGDSLGLDYQGPAAGSETTFVYRADLRPDDLVVVVADGMQLPGVQRVQPVIHRLDSPTSLQQSKLGMYHRLPANGYLLAVRCGSVGLSAIDARILANGGTIQDSGTCWALARFPDATSAQTARSELETLGVARVGPAVRGGPVNFITDQLVVSFVSDQDRLFAQPILDAHELVLIRKLPYIEHGFLYDYPTESYAIYDAARDLIEAGHARFAIPNLLTVQLDASVCTDTSCAGEPHQAYLNEMDICEARATAPKDAKDWTLNLGILDKGVNKDVPSACDRLRVPYTYDLASMEGCRADTEDWCADCSTLIDGWDDAHGIGVALIAAATRGETDKDLVGLAPGVAVLNVKRKTQDDGLMTDIQLSEALWWMGGGDPGWCRDGTNYDCSPREDATEAELAVPCPEVCLEEALPDPLGADRADVINLSFTREDFLTVYHDCSSNDLCKIVCADHLEECGVVNETMERMTCPDCGDGMRDGGAVLVAAVGNDLNLDDPDVCAGAPILCYPQAIPPGCSWSRRTDLAEAEATIAVGSVTRDDTFEWVPYSVVDTWSCLIQNPSDQMDTVAPFGSENEMKICTTCGKDGDFFPFGESSAAAAGVSGLAVLMLQSNPLLTADQVRCIIRETSEPRSASGEIWHRDRTDAWPETAFCVFEGGYSKCMGNGMTNFCDAMVAAAACSTASSDCPEACRTPAKTEEGEEEEEEGEWVVLEFANFTLKSPNLVVPDFIKQIIECMLRGDCFCEGDNCLGMALINPYDHLRHDLLVELCIGGSCWPLPDRIPEWPTGTTLRIPLSPEPEMLIPLTMGAAAQIKIRPWKSELKGAE